MASGGSRARSGPAPDPNALRRDRASDAAGWESLPAEGRGDVAAPEWPLTAATPRELAVWEAWWRKPVAVVWERDQQVEYVALVVRMFVEGEVEKASAENRKTVRMMMADLYLTSDSMARARLRIAPAVGASEGVEASVTPIQSRPSARDRLKVVNDVNGG